MLMAVDLTGFFSNPIEWSMTPFQMYFGVLMWPVIFAGVVGLTWGLTKNFGSVTMMIFLIFGLFGTTNAFIQSPELSFFFSVIAVAGIAGTVLIVFIKSRR